MAEGLAVTAMATEPMLINPTNIDVDERGRVWVTEAYNYRPEINLNPTHANGDRILILEDKDGDARLETSKVFYQGPEINAPLGVCVLGNRVLISQSPYVWSFTDEDGDDSADKKEILFQGIGGRQHDHGMHTFTFGPDGKLYFNFGNEGKTLKDKNGKPVLDRDGDEIGPKKYRQGMVFRCNPDGSDVECLGDNFRNNYEVAVDSYGTLWQSDNDDDGNRGVRINYVMPYGNYGYTDEMTGAGWRAKRTNMEDSIPLQHWHLNDPGVVPNLLQTGAGSPTGILVYEGSLLPKRLHNQVIHADAGVNVIRAYPVTKQGAGYSAEIDNMLQSVKDAWFRPADVCAAPDGSLIVADWYDPGVGGHQAGDQQRGRIYRIAPPSAKYTIPDYDYDKPEGAAEALLNPNLSVRHKAYTRLRQMKDSAVPALESIWRNNGEPRFRARALWILAQSPAGDKYIDEAFKSSNPDLRITGLRAALLRHRNVIPDINKLTEDPDAQVRREAALALYHVKDKWAGRLWAKLAAKHDGKDRWYLEAIGIAADGQWDEWLPEYLKLVPDPTKSAAGRDIIWRARTDKASTWLAALAADKQVPLASRLRYFRAFDFSNGPSKSGELLAMLDAADSSDAAYSKLILFHLDPKTISGSAKARRSLSRILDEAKGTEEFVELVDKYHYTAANPELLQLAIDQADEGLGRQAASLLLKQDGQPLISRALRQGDPQHANALLKSLGGVGNTAALQLVQGVMLSSNAGKEMKQVAAGALGRTDEGQDRVLELLGDGKVPKALIPYAVNGVKNSWRKSVYQRAVAYLPEGAGKKQNTKEPVLSDIARITPDIAAGAQVFRQNCALCHQAGKEGNDFGPKLTEIGTKLPKEALLEAIVHPSAGISFGYEGKQLTLKDGSSLTGIISSKTESEMEVKLPGGTVQRIAASDVKAVKEMKESMMPALYTAMSEKDLANLLGYLSSLKRSN